MISSPVLGISQGPCVAESEPALLTGAMQFGLSKNSHVAIAFDDTKVKNRYVIVYNVAYELIIKAQNIHIKSSLINPHVKFPVIEACLLFSIQSKVENRILFALDSSARSS